MNSIPLFLPVRGVGKNNPHDGIGWLLVKRRTVHGATHFHPGSGPRGPHEWLPHPWSLLSFANSNIPATDSIDRMVGERVPCSQCESVSGCTPKGTCRLFFGRAAVRFVKPEKLTERFGATVKDNSRENLRVGGTSRSPAPSDGSPSTTGSPG